jgi:hypothetical protein
MLLFLLDDCFIGLALFALFALLVASKKLGVSEVHTKTLVLWKNKRKKERKKEIWTLFSN